MRPSQTDTKSTVATTPSSSWQALDTATNYPLIALLKHIDTQFERRRHRRAGAGESLCPAVSASLVSSDYIHDFWPHVAQAISYDRSGLGLCVPQPDGTDLNAEALAAAFCEEHGNGREPQQMAAILSSLALMQQVFSYATNNWAQTLQQGDNQALPFELDVDAFVSLRMLLPRKDATGSRVGGNAPTLVMGGTVTAITFCWNLLLQIPRALRECNSAEPDAETVAAVWRDTRDAVFALGGGSLTAFVALASACASNPSAMVWDQLEGLSLSRLSTGYEWLVDASLIAAINQSVAAVSADQRGQFVGCAALFTRAQSLPLGTNDGAPDTDKANAFGELLRWITRVAEQRYFVLFD